MPKIKLFCFPYAGASALIFTSWKKYLDPNIELILVELAGRGKRINEVLYEDVSKATDDIFESIRSSINAVPYAFFGHSLGALLAYKLAQQLKNLGFRAPDHIFFSGRSAPHVIRPDMKKYHLMNEEEFKREVIELGGTPPEFFSNPELLSLFLPVLRNDFRLSEIEQPEDIRPLDCNVTVFLGKDEDLTSEQCDGWKRHTTKVCSIHHFEGAHFFINKETAQLAVFINAALRPWL